MRLSQHLGRDVSDLMNTEAISTWTYERSVDDDAGYRAISYEFKDEGLELRCDSNEMVGTIFVYRRKFGGFAAESVEGIPLSSKRAEVLEAMGSPTKHGRPLDDPQLGRYGAWDRFDRTSYAIHVQYQADADAIEMITLMHHSAVP